ncbi:hypothetical protein D3C80_1531160 [compost metagenome]
MPTARKAVLISIPASGNSDTANATERDAPEIYTSSSAADSNANAVFNSGRLRKISVHLARTIAGILGMEPAKSAETNNVQFGQL